MIRIKPADPIIVVPIFHSESTYRNPSNNDNDRHLKKRNKPASNVGMNHHASNPSTTILDEHKNLRSNLYYKLINGIAVPGGKLHHGAQSLWTKTVIKT